MKSIVDRYIKCIAAFYPGYADILNIYVPTLGNYSEESIKKFNDEIVLIRDLVDFDLNLSMNEKELLKKNILMRLFEINRLCNYKYKLTFYNEKIFLTLREALDFGNSAQQQEKLFCARMKCMKEIITQAEKSLIPEKMGVLEIISAKNEFNKICNEIEELAGALLTLEFYSAKQQYIDLIERCRNRSFKKLVPYEKEVFEEYINDLLGIRISIDGINLKSEELLDEMRLRKDTKSTVIECSEQMVMDTLREIYDRLNPVFGEFPELLDRIVIRNDCNMVKFFHKKVRSAAYYKEIIDGETKACFVFNKGSISTKARLISKLVHEIYPGHFYIDPKEEKVINTICPEDAFQEGWAKYCEYLLLYYWNDEVNSIVKEEIEHMLIMGIAVIKTHYYQETFIAMSKWLIEKCGYTTNEAKNIVLSAYLIPFDKIIYYIGFMTMYCIGEKYGVECLVKSVLKCERNYKTLYKLCDYDKEV